MPSPVAENSTRRHGMGRCIVGADVWPAGHKRGTMAFEYTTMEGDNKEDDEGIRLQPRPNESTLCGPAALEF